MFNLFSPKQTQTKSEKWTELLGSYSFTIKGFPHSEMVGCHHQQNLGKKHMYLIKLLFDMDNVSISWKVHFEKNWREDFCLTRKKKHLGSWRRILKVIIWKTGSPYRQAMTIFRWARGGPVMILCRRRRCLMFFFSEEFLVHCDVFTQPPSPRTWICHLKILNSWTLVGPGVPLTSYLPWCSE